MQLCEYFQNYGTFQKCAEVVFNQNDRRPKDNSFSHTYFHTTLNSSNNETSHCQKLNHFQMSKSCSNLLRALMPQSISFQLIATLIDSLDSGIISACQS